MVAILAIPWTLRSVNSKRGFEDQICQLVWGDGSWNCWRLPRSKICNRQWKILWELSNHSGKVFQFVENIGAGSINIPSKRLRRPHILPSFFDSPKSQSTRRLYALPTREGGPNTKDTIDYETEYGDADRMRTSWSWGSSKNSFRPRTPNVRPTNRLKKIRSRKKDLMESLQTEQRHLIEMASEKGASNWLTATT